MRITFPETYGNGEIQIDVLKAICGDVSDKSMVDLGCGFAPTTRKLLFKERTYVDIVQRDLAEEMPNFINEDILTFLYKGNFFDVVISTDNLEHFTKPSGWFLLSRIKQISNKQIIFVPLGNYLVEKEPTNDPDTHKSGWLPEEFEKLGWFTIVFPVWHELLGIGSFFAYHCDDLLSEQQRIARELFQKDWVNKIEKI